MHQLDQGLKLSLTGRPRTHALSRFKKQIKRWGQALPPVEPLVLDFGLGNFDRVGLIEYWIANEEVAGYCGKYLFVFKDQTCPKHRHKTKHETFFLLEGSIAVAYRGKRHILKPGGVLPIMPGSYHNFTGLQPSLLLEISMPCEIDDNFFFDRRIPIGGNYSSG